MTTGRGLKLIAAPAAEPLSLYEAMDQCSISSRVTTFESLLNRLIRVARSEAESRTGRALITQTWERTFDSFDDELWLDLAPAQSVASIKYDRQADGTEQTLAGTEYTLDAGSVRSRVVLAYGKAWPATLDMPNAVRVRFIAGYGDTAADVPEEIRHWIAMRVAQLFEHREQVITGTMVTPTPFVDALLSPYVIHHL